MLPYLFLSVVVETRLDTSSSYPAWIKEEDKAILTMHQQIISRNYRISLSTSDNRIFTLHIRNVQESDRGGYMCQINTSPVKSSTGYLDVLGECNAFYSFSFLFLQSPNERNRFADWSSEFQWTTRMTTGIRQLCWPIELVNQWCYIELDMKFVKTNFEAAIFFHKLKP